MRRNQIENKKSCGNMTNQCQMCLMPESKDDGVREREDFCSYCYKGGKIQFSGTREEFQDMVYNKMRKQGINPIMARFYTWTIRFAPYWKGR